MRILMTAGWRLALTLASALLAASIVQPALAQKRGLEITAKHLEVMRTEKRVALVIGNASYKREPLRNPVNDARAMSKKLRSLGFEVIERINADKKRMQASIIDFGQTLREGGVGVFYFAGHGIRNRNSNFILPVDAQMTEEKYLRAEGVNVDELLSEMGDAGNRLNILILDACRNNPYRKRTRGLRVGGLAQMRAPTGTYVSYAAAPGEIAFDGDGEHSPYTQALLDVIDQPGVKLEEAFKQVRTKVHSVTNGQQVPFTEETVLGEFYFRLPTAAAILNQTELNSLSDSDLQKARTAPGDDEKPKDTQYTNGRDGPVVGDFTNALQEWMPLAEKGNASAQFALGMMYDKGHGVARNYVEAVKWFRRAANLGYRSAQFQLGLKYANGKGVKKNIQASVKWYRKAAIQGSLSAQYVLGLAYERGQGVAQNFSEAVRWYRHAANRANAPSQINLGYLYAKGKGIAKNENQAVRLFQSAALQGHAIARYNLGVMYAKGQGVDQDFGESRKWFRMAAIQGYEVAQRILDGLGNDKVSGMIICKNAIQTDQPKWDSEYDFGRDIEEAKLRGFTEQQCARLTERFTEKQLSTFRFDKE